MKLDSSTESFKKAGKRKYLINPIYKALPIELKRKELGKARRKKRNEYILSNFDCNKTIEENAKELNIAASTICLLYTSDAADDLLCVDFGGRRIIKKK